DDAVHVRRNKDGWTLWVAIADVSRYVRPGSGLDREGAWRGNSVYFPDRVIPMLPEALSNGLCSLNPDVDRLAVVCCMDIDASGERRSATFHEAVIRSHARLTYNEVAAQLSGAKLPKSSRARALADELDAMYELYGLFRARREARGALDIDSIEPRFVYNDERKIERVEPVIRNDAHRIIEEFMIAANFSTAEFLDASERSTVYRIHESPDPDRAADLRTMLGGLGLTLAGGEQPEPRDFNAALQAARGRPDAHLIETAVMRTMKMATYATVNHGHFGLAAPAYLHFTSPIRRYPDLLVHRAIKAELGARGAAKAAPDEELASRSAEHCSMTERRADDATRDAVNWLKCEFMLDHVGEAFAGTISSVTNFGIFVELDDIFVEGLVHVTSLPRDYYQFDPVRHTLSGDKGGMRFRLGDRVSVKVAAVSLDEKKIDFLLAEQAGESDKKHKKSGGGGGRRKRRGGRSRK
ncbi:MAG: VacB/RNase II family 3'-5' exoribonuclease, partial [Gammaproteobacteria bacterium]|nr:VacB/RNase II family 3'-5' exoribonuclease [Gammaproteobacteria bacterium]